MPMFNCNAWVHKGDETSNIDTLLLDKKIFADTLPLAIVAFGVKWRVAMASNQNGYIETDIHVSVDQLQEVQNP